MAMNFKRKLPIPMDIKEQYPLTLQMAEQKAKNDAEIKAVFTGESDKLLLVIGPCSADSKEPVLDYISRLAEVREKVKDRVVIVPRIYTNKPRTTGSGYKGMLHQPDPNEKPDMLHGIVAIRELHMCALKEYGFSCADEMLYPANYRYLSDLLSYVAVGARSVENQEHRLTASGFDIPVGMKNPTSGDLSIMMNAIMRGFVDRDGHNISNYHYEDLLNLSDTYAKFGLKNPSCIVDANHANSGKKYLEQVRITKDILYSRAHNDDIKKLVKGIMIESYIEDGAQKIGDGIYGKSITDPCLGWEKTKRLILDIAEQA